MFGFQVLEFFFNSVPIKFNQIGVEGQILLK